MQKKIEAQLKEHVKYQRQCQKRIRPSLLLCGITTIIMIYITYTFTDGWKVGIPFITVSWIYTIMEIYCFKKHGKAIKELEQAPGYE